MASGDLKLQILLDTIDRVSGPLKKIQGGSSAAARALKGTQAALRGLNALQQDIRGFRELESQLASTSNKLVAARRQYRQLSDVINAAEAPTKEQIAALREQGAQVGKLAAQQKRLQTELTSSSAALRRAGLDTSRLGVHERELQQGIEKANRALDQQRARLDKLRAAQARMKSIHNAGKTLAMHGAGGIAAGTVAVRNTLAPVAAFAKQEDAAAQLRASMMAAGGKVLPEYQAIGALAQQLGNRLPGTTADFYEMMTMLRRQGMSGKAILGGLGEATAYIGVQLKMGYGEAAEFAAKLQDATRTSERDMLKLADTIQRGFYLGVDPDNMLQGFSKLSPAMDVLKVQGIEATKAFAPLLVMADQAGMAGEQAGNAYRKVFQGAMDAAKVGKANGLIQNTGIKLDFTDGKGEFGGLDQLFAQLKRLESLNTQDRLAVLKKLFGDDAETLQVVSLMISKGAAGYAEVQAKLAAQASQEERINSQLGTLSNLWEATTGTFGNVLAAFGQSAEPELKAIASWLGSVAERVQRWVKENPVFAATLFKIAAGAALLVTVLGGAALALGTMLMPFAGLQMALTTAAPLLGIVAKAVLGFGNTILGALRTIGMALAANPIGLALMLIATVAYVIWRNWDTLGPMFAALWARIVAGLQVAAAWLGGIWERIKAAAAGAWTALVGLVTGLGERMRAGLSLAWTAIKLVLLGWPAFMLQLGVDLVAGLVNGISSRVTAVTEAIRSVGSAAIGGLKTMLGIHSPSRVFATLGDYTMQGFAGGLQRSASEPLARLGAFGDRLRTAGARLAITAAATPAMALDTRPPLSGAAGAAPAASVHYEIHIHAAPGMDAQALARAVSAELDRREQAAAARRRSAFVDY
ncbi:phage tail tape measure protein [Lysobacter arvi]|uniref:Phage tail tape measure protein n=1 Tax=Lysobacter arvi TaxID=3038776 RepID=A0ABU1CB51_9GAMM|nr:phage tail tape measure protein [Lysobacter arvi]MDR0182418.1 phage tail tape measure protein [Lysobacter arvi]